jgi:hypothetical protein
LGLITFYTIHFEIYRKIHLIFGNVIYLYTLMNFKYKEKMCRKNDYPLNIKNYYISKMNHTSQNCTLNWTLHYLEEVYHIKLFFKHTEVENWTWFMRFSRQHDRNQWNKIFIQYFVLFKIYPCPSPYKNEQFLLKTHHQIW